MNTNQDQFKTIIIEIRNVYGIDKIYPACEKSQLFADIAGTKTLTRFNLNKIEALGYTIMQKETQPIWRKSNV